MQQRLKQFPDSGLKISAGKIWCEACRQNVPNISSSIHSHLGTKKHRDKFDNFLNQQSGDRQVCVDIATHFENNTNEKFATVRPEVHVLRYRTVEAFLISGTPLDRVPFFRPLIERAEASLTDASNLKIYIPQIESREFALIKSELAGNFVSLTFDGTSRLGEAINLTARWCSKEFKICQRLVRFLTTKLHLNAAQLASIITTTACTELGLEPDQIVSFTRDSASVNGAAVRILGTSPFCHSEQVLCICHTLNNVGVRLNFDVLSSFMTPWLELVGGQAAHAGAKALWRAAVKPTPVPGFSNTRWYSKAEIQFVIAQHFDALKPFLHDLAERDYGDATRQKMCAILDDEAKALSLRLQLAAMLDVRSLVATTYELEGDRLEVLLVYDRVERLRALGRSLANHNGQGVLPHVDAVLRSCAKLGVGVEIEKKWEGHGFFRGKVVAVEMIDSTIREGEEATGYKVCYPADKTFEHLEEEEIRPLVYTLDMEARKQVVAELLPAFNYLESRLLGTCDAQYSCEHMYEVSFPRTHPLM